MNKASKTIDIFELQEKSRYYTTWVDPSKPIDEREYYSIIFRASDTSREYNREVPEILDVLDGLGGFIQFVYLFGITCTGFLTKR